MAETYNWRIDNVLGFEGITMHAGHGHIHEGILYADVNRYFDSGPESPMITNLEEFAEDIAGEPVVNVNLVIFFNLEYDTGSTEPVFTISGGSIEYSLESFPFGFQGINIGPFGSSEEGNIPTFTDVIDWFNDNFDSDIVLSLNPNIPLADPVLEYTIVPCPPPSGPVTQYDLGVQAERARVRNEGRLHITEATEVAGGTHLRITGGYDFGLDGQENFIDSVAAYINLDTLDITNID